MRSDPFIRVRVLLVDDHALVRAGIAALLERMEGVEVVGEAGDGHDALDLIEKRSPDVVLLDLSLPGLNGAEVLQRACARFPDVHLIILTMHEEPEYVIGALRAGAAGYVSKSAASAELGRAISQVMAGTKYLSPALQQNAIQGARSKARTDPTGAIAELTPRQREVLKLIVEGHCTKKIACLLGVSIKTIETHRAHLMERLDIHDVARLVRYALKTGLISLGDDEVRWGSGTMDFRNR